MPMMLGNDKNTYRISAEAASKARELAELYADRSMEERRLPCWDERCADIYCTRLGEIVESVGVRQ